MPCLSSQHASVLFLRPANDSANYGPRRQAEGRCLDRWVQRQKEEAMRNLPKDLEVLPSPLLLEQMEREAVQLRSPPASLVVHQGPAAKPMSSFCRKKHRRGVPSCVSAAEEYPMATAVTSGAVVSLPAGGRAAASKPASLPATAPSPRLAAPPPMPSSLAPARCSEATPDELEERLRFFARQIKTFRKTSLMYSSPELMERIRQMEEDYGAAVRQFYCRPPPSTPGLQEAAAAAAEQSTPGLQGAAASAAEQSTPGLQGAAAAAAEQSTPGLQGAAAAAAEQSTPGLQGAAAAAEQPTPGLQGAAAAAEQPTPGLQSAAAAAEQSTSGLQPAVELPEGPEGGLPSVPGPEHLLSFLWGVFTELKPDTHHDTLYDTLQPVSARSDTPQPVSARSDTPQPVSTSSTRRRGRRKRDASVHTTKGLDDASALAHVTEGPADASASSLQGLSGKLVLVLGSEPCDEGFEEEEPPDPPLDEGFEEEAPPDPVFGEFKEQFILVLTSEPRDEGFEDEALSDSVPEGFKEQFVLVLASEARDEGSPGATSASEGSPGAASASEGSPGAASASEGSPGAASASEGSTGAASASEGSTGIRRRPPELCACWGRPPGRPPELCPCF
ncbi:hypothetical protein CRENBAI_020390 [Crenichthys baileyi]|uniref:Uncharacterized protein n=1 Tax=Crenichthys baileyi TaxID=28760 RepID=A0AAV9SIP4_9TELE